MLNDFTLDDLNRMYEEAMKWKPAVPGNPASDPRAVLQKIIAAREQNREQTRQ